MNKGLLLTFTLTDIAYSPNLVIGFSATSRPLKPKIKGRCIHGRKFKSSKAETKFNKSQLKQTVQRDAVHHNKSTIVLYTKLDA